MTSQKNQSYLIYSPVLDQSQTISYYLHKYFPDARINGLLMSGERKLNKNKCYDKLINLNEIDYKIEYGTEIPTGAKSTIYLLSKGKVTLGSITLTQDALLVYDKPTMIDYAQKNGIIVPETWRSVSKIKSFPCFYKQAYESGGGARGVARSPENIPLRERENLIYQEIIDSPGTYGVGFIAKNGRLLVTHTHFERESIPKEGGSAVIIERYEDVRLIEKVKKLINSLNYSGWGLAEFKYCPKREDYIFMEINAKFWASCEFAFRNEPLFLRYLFGIESKENPTYRMIFLDRAFLRGLCFIIKNRIFFEKNTSFRLYPNWSKRFIIGMIPNWTKRFLKNKNKYLIKNK